MSIKLKPSELQIANTTMAATTTTRGSDYT